MLTYGKLSGLSIGIIIGFRYSEIGLGMILGIVLGRQTLTKIPLYNPLLIKIQKIAAGTLLTLLIFLFTDHWYVLLKHVIANLINKTF